MYILMAERRGWTPDVVDAQPPDFVDEYLTYIRAETDHRAERERAERGRQERGARHHKFDHRHIG